MSWLKEIPRANVHFYWERVLIINMSKDRVSVFIFLFTLTLQSAGILIQWANWKLNPDSKGDAMMALRLAKEEHAESSATLSSSLNG